MGWLKIPGGWIKSGRIQMRSGGGDGRHIFGRWSSSHYHFKIVQKAVV
jgi:hypothetical protein